MTNCETSVLKLIWISAPKIHITLASAYLWRKILFIQSMTHFSQENQLIGPFRIASSARSIFKCNEQKVDRLFSIAWLELKRIDFFLYIKKFFGSKDKTKRWLKRIFKVLRGFVQYVGHKKKTMNHFLFHVFFSF